MKALRHFLFLAIITFAFGLDPNSVGYQDSDTGIVFPSILAGMSFGGIRHYEQPGLGYSLTYNSPASGMLTIYVYDEGNEQIPPGCDNEMVQSEFDKIELSLKYFEEQGVYSNIKVLNRDIIPKQGYIKFLWGKYSYTINENYPPGPGNVISQAFVTGFSKKFIKIRYTCREENVQEQEKTSELLRKEIILAIDNSIVPLDYNNFDFTIQMDDSLPEKQSALWLAYTIYRTGYMTDHNEIYKIRPGLLTPLFEEEVFARQQLVQIYQEIKESDKSLLYEYLDQLSLVNSEGLMKEYVWTFLKQPNWVQPEGLKLIEFDSWRQKNLKDHTPQTYGRIQATIKKSKD